MKKGSLFLTIIVLSLAIILAGCGTTNSNNTSGAQKTLRVVTDASYAPFEYMDKGKITGFDVDVMNAVAKAAGYKVDIENVGWNPLFVEVKGGTADIGMAAITITSDRKQTYDFSNPYFLSTNMILIPKGSSIKNGNDLKGKTVAVQNATTGQAVAEKILGVNSPNILKFTTITLAIKQMETGGAQAVVSDNNVVKAYAEQNPQDNLKAISDPSFPAEYYGLMFAKGSKLEADINKGIATIINNGTYTKIYKKWFNTTPDLATLKAQQK